MQTTCMHSTNTHTHTHTYTEAGWPPHCVLCAGSFQTSLVDPSTACDIEWDGGGESLILSSSSITPSLSSWMDVNSLFHRSPVHHRWAHDTQPLILQIFK